MIFQLTEREVQLLVEALRLLEKNSRRGFFHSANKLLTEGKIQELGEKNDRAQRVFRELVELRGKLGDPEEVKL